ncbi:MAG: hypothetical protein ACI4UL_00940 [Muribaculaceae bacterium]
MKKFTLFVASAFIAIAANAITIPELAGTYVSQFSCYYVSDWSSSDPETWGSWSSECEVVITVNSDNTITASNLGANGAEFTGTVDVEKNIITFAPASDVYYTYCASPAEFGTDGYGYGSADTTAPIVATIDENGGISLNYVATYGGYVCSIYPSEVLAKLDWSVNGSLNFYEYDSATESYADSPTQSISATLRKYTDGGAVTRGCQYELVNTDLWPDYMQFNVDDGLVDLLNTYDDYYYWYYINGTSTNVTAFYSADYGEFDGDKESGYVGMEYYDYPDYNYDEYTYGWAEFVWGTSGLNSIKTDKVDANAPVFDIMGRVVNDTTVPGIYIQNGKKFIVR